MFLILRGFNILRGMVSSLVGWTERRNPAVLLENERENLVRLIRQFNAGLVQHAAVIERLTTQVSNDERLIETLTYRINALMGAGERDAAARDALALKTAKSQVGENQRLLAESQDAYGQLVSRRDAAVAESRARIERVRRQIGDLKVKRAIADIEGMAQAMIGELDSGGTSLARLEDLVTEEREKASARARVAQGSNYSPDAKVSRQTQDALASAALDEFLHASTRALPDLRPVESALLNSKRRPKP
jgi:hypothetical protein